jgi:adenosine kinase
MAVLCTGSVAIDHIMVYRGRFKDVILPDRLHVLNVAFHVPELRRTFGGCAANIGFNLKLLGEEPIVLATVGADDFASYAGWLARHGIRQDHIVGLAGEATAGAYITTDLDDNQIVGFHPGAMDRAHEAGIARVTEAYELAFVSPNGKRAMQEHARALKRAGKRTLIDPGQGLPLFERDELIELIDGAELLFANDYEWSLVQERTGLGEAEIVARVGAAIVPLGERGSRILERGRAAIEIAPVRARAVVDPTGCGDAYRAGLMVGMHKGYDWPTCGRLAGLLGAIKIAQRGGQNHRFTWDEVADRFQAEFGYTL